MGTINASLESRTVFNSRRQLSSISFSSETFLSLSASLSLYSSSSDPHCLHIKRFCSSFRFFVYGEVAHFSINLFVSQFGIGTYFYSDGSQVQIGTELHHHTIIPMGRASNFMTQHVMDGNDVDVFTTIGGQANNQNTNQQNQQSGMNGNGNTGGGGGMY